MLHAVRIRTLALALAVVAGAAALTIGLAAGDGHGLPTSASASANRTAAAASESSASRSSSTGAARSKPGKPVKLSIKNFMFTKPKLVVTDGTKITWTNRDEVAHTVTANKTGGPSSDLIKPGGTYTWVADKKGLIKYHCSPHHFMKATIVVK